MRMLRFCLSFAAAISISTISSNAHELAPTIYDDGRSCPGDCDAHVVLNPTNNGTSHAHKPGTQSSPQRCANGRDCRICFGHTADSCMIVLYRGGGPPAGKLDFTPAFYKQFCGTVGIPSRLSEQCNALDRAVSLQGYDERLNCVIDSSTPQCASVIGDAQTEYDADLEAYNECVRLGEASFNTAQPDVTTRRIYDCAYSQLKTGGPNRNGLRWHQLLPAACRPGTFVGRDGLDCCGGEPRVEAALHPECSPYYQEP